MNKYIKTILIVIVCFLFTPTTYGQWLYTPIEASKTASKDTSYISNTKDSVGVEVLTTAHKKNIEEAVKNTSYGDILWTYFGEILLAGIGLVIVYIRVTIREIFSKVLRDLKEKYTKEKKHTNKDIGELGALSEDVDGYLTKIKEMTKSKRVLLYQFSNGSHFFSSIPVLRITVTNHSEGDSIKPTDNVFNYASAKEIIHQILNDEYLEIKNNTTETKYCGYVSYLRFANFKNSTLLRLNVSDNYCGIIELIEPEEFDLPEVRSYAISIGHLFERYSKDKKEA